MLDRDRVGITYRFDFYHHADPAIIHGSEHSFPTLRSADPIPYDTAQRGDTKPYDTAQRGETQLDQTPDTRIPYLKRLQSERTTHHKKMNRKTNKAEQEGDPIPKDKTQRTDT